MKPNTRIAMRQLIDQVREAMPFDAPQAQVCTGPCDGCSLKLLSFLDSELQEWERRLADGERPNLGDLSRLASISRKIYGVLERNGLVAPERAG